jgi:hypothetical protein
MKENVIFLKKCTVEKKIIIYLAKKDVHFRVIFCPLESGFQIRIH